MIHRLYRRLVTRLPGIRDRYQLWRQTHGRWSSLWYLLGLLVQYHLLFRRSLRQPFSPDETKRVYTRGSESSRSRRDSPEQFARSLLAYDVISFDIFDTLIFRPFSHPADLFFLMGMELEYPRFRELRMAAEVRARELRQELDGSCEVTLAEIWRVLEADTGIPQETGMRIEQEWEARCAYPNPYMLQVAAILHREGKSLAAVSDMYLGTAFLRGLLDRCGYPPFAEYLVSGDQGVSKHRGGLYDRLRRRFGDACRYVHVGDHPWSDHRQAIRHRISARLYPNIQQTGNRYRAEDLSAITGSIYRGVVNAHLHNGLTVYSKEYEYGFVYGGLFVTGYCRFIHEYAAAHGVDKLLFLSRDGAVLLQAYRRMYPEETDRTVYAYWSRLAAVKLTAGRYPAEYGQRFVSDKADQGYSIRRILEGMELSDLLDPLCQETNLPPEALLTHKTAQKIKKYLIDHWDQVLAGYAEQQTAARLYYRGLLEGCTHAAAVDIGWAGSGAVMLDRLVSESWGLGCRITGILAGTLSGSSPQANEMEPLFLSGRLVSYLYSQRENRDLWAFHDPARNHNLYWELLLGAPEGSLQGFYLNDRAVPVPRFRKAPPHSAQIREIHRGILDFVNGWLETEQRIGRSIPISGRDGYAPMRLLERPQNTPFFKGWEALLDEAHIV